MEKTRIVWVDNTKILAIVLVALGHLLMGLYGAGIFTEQNYPEVFVNYIYMFHVPLFFICSGFLYQQFTKMDSIKDYGKNILKKLLSLGIPYFVFVTAMYLLKEVFSSSVNYKNPTGLFEMFFLRLSAPYWFLYALFFIFLVTPVFKKKSAALITLIIAAGLYFFRILVGFDFLPVFLSEIFICVCDNLYWFVLGAVISLVGTERFFKKHNLGLFVLFTVIFALAVKINVHYNTDKIFYGTLACEGIVSFFVYFGNRENKITTLLSKYSMPVFLMHTIFAAGVRSVLLKFGITNLPLHLIAGLTASFVLPAAAAFVMEKIKLDFLYNPTKYIKIK